MERNLQTSVHELTPVAKARILRELKKGDKARIAELVGVYPGYVKDVLGRRPGAKSVLARRIWFAADRLLKERARLQQELRQAC
jgi:hypothetical protein